MVCTSVAIIVKSPLYCFFQQQRWPHVKNATFDLHKTTPAMLGQRFLFKNTQQILFWHKRELILFCEPNHWNIYIKKKGHNDTKHPVVLVSQSYLSWNSSEKLPNLYLIIRAPGKTTFSHLLLQSPLCRKCFMCSIISFVTCGWQSRGVSRM